MKSYSLFNVLIIFIVFGCSTEIKKESVEKKENISSSIEKVDCNYFWPARKVHVCIKDMPKQECEDLFSLGQFYKEEECYCDTSGKEKNYIKGQNYIQYDCR